MKFWRTPTGFLFATGAVISLLYMLVDNLDMISEPALLLSRILIAVFPYGVVLGVVSCISSVTSAAHNAGFITGAIMLVVTFGFAPRIASSCGSAAAFGTMVETGFALSVFFVGLTISLLGRVVKRTKKSKK